MKFSLEVVNANLIVIIIIYIIIVVVELYEWFCFLVHDLLKIHLYSLFLSLSAVCLLLQGFHKMSTQRMEMHPRGVERKKQESVKNAVPSSLMKWSFLNMRETALRVNRLSL